MNIRWLAAFLATPMVLAAVPVAAQVFTASGFLTVSIAGLGNTTTVAGDSRIPILPRDIEYNAGSGNLHIRATGHRGAVRQVDITVRNPRTGGRFDLGGAAAATLSVHLEDGAELSAATGHGDVQIVTMDEHHVIGTYEGTFSHGAVPVVIRGRFEASFPRPQAASGAPTTGR